jgi:large subunit ribosomal protein L1
MAEAKKKAKSSKQKTDSKSKETKEKQLKHGDVVAEAVAPENAPEAVIEVEPVTDLAAKTSPTKFDASVEMHINLGVDPRQADQNVRDSVVLPAGTGKTIKIAVLAEADDAAKAKKAGAETAGTDEIFAKLDKEELDFDVLIATPALMPKLGKYARLLGPRGLMPNPKSGTVSQNPEAAVAEAKAGKVEYRVDQSGIVHLSAGKVSFGAEKLTQNAEAILASIRTAKPASLKGIYMQSVYVTTTMGPSIKVEI